MTELQIRCGRIIYLILAFCMLASILNVGDVEALETEKMSSVCQEDDDQKSYIFSNNGDVAETRICTLRMLGVRNVARFVSTEKKVNQNLFIKVFYDLFCEAKLGNFTSDAYGGIRFSEAPKLCDDGAIVDYIHNQDGEKDNNPFFI